MTRSPSIVVLVVAILGCMLLSACSNEKPTTQYHCFLIEQGDSCVIDFRFTIHSGLAVSDGKVVRYDPHRVFFGYDTSIVFLNKSTVLPKGVGRTEVFVRHPSPDSSFVVDTIRVIVEDVRGHLKVRQ